MIYSFHPDAIVEFNQAIDYYEACQSGLGLSLVKEIYAVIQRIVEHPHAWTPLSKNTRRCLTNRFPFGVIYQVVEQEILILAIMQLNRRPDYWRRRARRLSSATNR